MDTISPGRKGVVFYVRQVAGIIVLLALSATFFYSAYSKSGLEFHHFRVYRNDNAFDGFQWTFLDLGINSIIASGVIARLMIGLELLLGLFLLFHIYLKRFTYPAVIGILVVFIIYLLMVILKQGNTGNCGCFGDKLAMSPLAAIWKNVGMIAATILLWFIYPPKPRQQPEITTEGIPSPSPLKRRDKLMPYIALCIATIACSAPFLANNVYIGTDPDKFTKTVDFSILYKYNPAPPVDLMTGKHIIAFMSLTCPHCKKAAYLLQIIHRDHPDIPIYMVLDGPEAYQQKFFDETHAGSIPYTLFYGHTNDFVAIASTGVPSIYWVNNGVAEYKSTYAYYQLDPKFMEKWLKQPN